MTGDCPAYAFSCALNCQDSTGTCYALNGNFVDGTPCGGVGRCLKGSCDGTNISNYINSRASPTMDKNLSAVCVSNYCSCSISYFVCYLFANQELLLQEA